MTGKVNRLRHVATVTSIACVALGVTLSAGLGSQPAAAASARKITLTLAAYTPAQAGLTAIIANFEHLHPNITISGTYLATAQLLQELPAELQAGNGPDIIEGAPGNTSPVAIYPLVAANRLLSLTKEPWAKATLATVKPWLTVKGNVYGFMPALDPFGVFYSTSVLKRVGVGIPSTFSQLLTACQKISAAGVTPISAGLAGGITTQLSLAEVLAATFVYAQDPNWTTERDANKVTFASSPLWKADLTAITQMIGAKCFTPEAQGVTLTQSLSAVADRQAAMFIAPDALVPSVTAINPGWTYELGPFPAPNAKNDVLFSSGNPFVINKATHNAQAAEQFLQFMATPAQEAIYSQQTGAVSIAAIEKKKVPAYLQPSLQVVKNNRILFSFVAGYPNDNLMSTVLSPDITGLFTGQKTVASILADLDANWNPPGA